MIRCGTNTPVQNDKLSIKFALNHQANDSGDILADNAHLGLGIDGGVIGSPMFDILVKLSVNNSHK